MATTRTDREHDRAAEEAQRMADELLAMIQGVVGDYADRLARAGRDLEAVGGAATVAAAVAAVLPRVNRLAVRAGPVYTTGQLTRLLPGVNAAPITDQAVRNRREERRLVGAKTRDGRWVYPAFQFRVGPGRLQVRDDVVQLWRELPHQTDRLDAWTLIAWLTGTRRDLEGQTPLQWLDRHGLDARLRRAAGQVRRRASAA